MKTLLVFCLHLFLFEALNAQTYERIPTHVLNFSIQDGLPSNNISFSFQDSKGFIWIGTYSGLSKFNGYQFYNFFPDPNKKEFLNIGQFVSYLKVSDSIYYLTSKFDGILKLNVFTNQLNKLKNSPNATTSMIQDKDGSFWIGTTADGFYHYFPKTGAFKHLLLKPKVKDFKTNWDYNSVNDLCLYPNNDSLLLLGNRNGLYVYNKLSGVFIHYHVESKLYLQETALNHIRSLCLDTKGNLWVGRFFGGLGKFDLKTKSWEHFFFDPLAFNYKVLNTNIVENMRLQKDSYFTMSTDKGPMEFDLKTKKFKQYNVFSNDLNIDGNVVNFTIDKNENMWFSHINQQGLSLASKRYNAIEKIDFPKQIAPNDYYPSVILGAYFSKRFQKYFFTLSNHDGVLSYSADFKVVKQYQIPNNYNLYEPTAYKIAEDQTGKIWLNDFSNNLMEMDATTGLIENHKSSLFNKCLDIIGVVENNQVFFHTDSGLFRLKETLWENVLPLKDVELFSNIKGKRIYYIKGLEVFVLDIESKRSVKVCDLPRFANDNMNFPQRIYLDTKNRLWITLQFGGIYRYDLATKKLQLLSVKEGLYSSYTRQMREDKNGTLFLVCNGGFYYYNEVQNRFVDFDNLTLKKTNDWYEDFLFFTEDDKLLLTKENAFYLIDKNEVLKNDDKTPVVTDVFSHSKHFISNFEDLDIPSYQNDVKIYLSNFDYSSASELVFEYQLLPASKEWVKLDKGINQVNFTNLNEGTYTFKVRLPGSNNYSECKFKIHVVWYKSNWFYAINTALFSLLVLFSIYYYYKRQSKEKELQKRLAELKLSALQSQLNPHFLFNCLTSISGLIKLKEYTKAEKILGDFAKLMRSILINSSKDLIPLKEELEISKLYLDIESLRKNHVFKSEFKLEFESLNDFLVPPLMLQPFLENSVKHGFINKTEDDLGLIEIEISKLVNGLQILVKDNGIGLVKSKPSLSIDQYRSMGLQIQKERLQQYLQTHGLDIKFHASFAPHIGTDILISLEKK